MVRCACLGFGLILLAAAAAHADLEVVDVSDGAGVDFSEAYFIVTDPGHWEVMIDKATGAIFSFRDLTDAGVSDGQGGTVHTNYVGTSPSGTDYAYHLQAPLLYVKGCSGTTDRALTLYHAATGLADRLQFSMSADRKSFSVSYHETAASADFLWDPSTYLVNGVAAGARGDLLTDVVLTLHEADAAGTVFRLVVTVTVSQPDFGQVNSRVFTDGLVGHCLRSESAFATYGYVIQQTVDGDSSRITGEWNEAAPKSFTRRTISGGTNNATLGLTAGRTFILDHVRGFEDNPLGGGFYSTTWFGARLLYQTLPYGIPLVDGQVVQQVVDLRINIMAPEASVPPLTIAADTDSGWVYQNASSGDLVHRAVLHVAAVEGFLPEETYDVIVGESAGDLTHFLAELPVVLDASGAADVALAGTRVDDAAVVPESATIVVTVTGRTYRQVATADVPLSLRKLGDITGDGVVNASDKLEMNKRLNGLANLDGITLRDLDLVPDGLINASDKLEINRILNGL